MPFFANTLLYPTLLITSIFTSVSFHTLLESLQPTISNSNIIALPNIFVLKFITKNIKCCTLIYSLFEYYKLIIFIESKVSASP